MMGILLSACWLMAGCTVIDDDLSECYDGQQLQMDYELRLVTNMTTEIKTQLSTQLEVGLAHALKEHLSSIFSDNAHDVDLSFYDTEGAMPRLQHDQHIMDANQQSYTLNLPMHQYMHLAVANVVDNPVVGLNSDEFCPQSHLSTVIGSTAADTIASHTTGLFTARQPMDVKEGIDQTFNVTLYMVNSASILLIRTDGVDYKDVKVTSSDFADGFYVDDSLFTYNNNRVVNDLRVTTPPVEREVFYAITFPSCDTPELAQANYPDEVSRADGSTGATDEDRVWRKTVYVTLPDGKITRTVINVHQPLLAGQVSIIYCYMKPDGGIWSPNVEVGTSVTFDWKEGLVIEDGR